MDGWLYVNSYVPEYQQETASGNSEKMWEFYSSSSGVLQNSLTRWYGGSYSDIDNGIIISTGSINTTDYFAECTSFLDVGCYLE